MLPSISPQRYIPCASGTDLQAQRNTAFLTGGTSTAFTATASPAPVAYAENMLFDVEFNAAPGAAPTINFNSLGAKNLKYRDSAGALQAVTAGLFPSGWRSLLVYDGTDFIVREIPTGSLPCMSIQGFTFAIDGTDPTNDIAFSTGQARDASNAADIRQTSALIKRLDANFVVGTNQGMLDTGAVGNSDYYLWAIKRSDTGVCDFIASLSSTAPTMPANYDYKRLIGWIKRVGGVNVLFDTYETEGGGVELAWRSPTLDIDLANTLTTTRRTDAVKVPLNFSVEATLNVVVWDAASGANVWIYCPDQSDLAPSFTAAPLSNNNTQTAAAAVSQLTVRTSATGTIAARADLATVDSYKVSTIKFRWARRN